MKSFLTRRSPRRVSRVAAAAALVLVATACTATPATTDGPGSATPRPGGTLRVAIPSGISGFDPLKIAGPIDDIVAETGVYDTLMRFDKVGSDPGPMLAVSATPNEDNTVWTVKLRTGVTFHDGTPFDAEAVKFNFDRQLDPKNGASAAAILTPIEAVDVVDDSTVTFSLKYPWPNLPYLLTFPPAIMASPTAIQKYGDDYTNHPVGTGPYMLESQTAGAEYVLVRNPDYWNKDSAGFVDKIIYKVIANESSAYQTLTTGGVDMLAVAGADTIVKAKADPTLTVSQCPGSVATAPILPMNIGKAPLDDVRVRQAMNYAIDRSAIAQGLYQGLVEPSAGPFAGSRWDNGVTYPQFDLDKAKELMAEYTADGGAPVEITLTSTQGSPLPAVLQDMWEQIGITTEISIVDVPTLIGSIIKKQFDVVTFSSSIYPNPDFVFYAFNHSSSPLVLSATGDDRIDTALVNARSAATIEEQKAQYKVVDEWMANESPWIWLTNGLQASVFSGSVQGALQPEDLRPTCIPYLPGLWLTH